MQKKTIYLIAILVLLLIILGGVYLLLHPIKDKNSSHTTNQLWVNQEKADSQDTIRLASYQSLDIFTDARGMTLYHNLHDWPLDTKPPYHPYTQCTGTCSVTWLPFYTDNIAVSAPLKSSDFMIFTRPDGKKQVVYRGWPLYYYTGDTNPGDVRGQNIGNIWYAGISPN